jgi:hypothetical protein
MATLIGRGPPSTRAARAGFSGREGRPDARIGLPVPWSLAGEEDGEQRADETERGHNQNPEGHELDAGDGLAHMLAVRDSALVAEPQ